MTEEEERENVLELEGYKQFLEEQDKAERAARMLAFHHKQLELVYKNIHDLENRVGRLFLWSSELQDRLERLERLTGIEKVN